MTLLRGRRERVILRSLPDAYLMKSLPIATYGLAEPRLASVFHIRYVRSGDRGVFTRSLRAAGWVRRNTLPLLALRLPPGGQCGYMRIDEFGQISGEAIPVFGKLRWNGGDDRNLRDHGCAKSVT